MSRLFTVVKGHYIREEKESKIMKESKDMIISLVKESVIKLVTEWNDWFLHFPYGK